MARPSALDNMNIGQLQQLLLTRKNEVAKLHKQRADLAKKLAKIDQKLSRIDGSVGGRGRGAGLVLAGGRKRAKNPKSLADMIHDVLSKNGKSAGVGDIMEAVQDAGYHTTSPSFRGIVNQTLIKDKRFTSSGERGMYQLKK
jgi:hypothetical protein